jgi:uncharacterized protein (TIGR02246 family)
MSDDEKAIRTLIDTWFEATAANDLARVLQLMDDEVVFLTPGRPPMRKEMFAAASRTMEHKVRFDGRADVQEIRVFGDWAYLWNQLTVTVHPSDGGPTVRRSGPVLSVLRKKADGRWVMFRDANMLTADTPHSANGAQS